MSRLPYGQHLLSMASSAVNHNANELWRTSYGARAVRQRAAYQSHVAPFCRRIIVARADESRRRANQALKRRFWHSAMSETRHRIGVSSFASLNDRLVAGGWSYE